MLNLAISTIVFFVAAWFLNGYLDQQGIPKGLILAAMAVQFMADGMLELFPGLSH